MDGHGHRLTDHRIFLKGNKKSNKPSFGTGLMGVFEFENFAHGTREIAKAVADQEQFP